MLNHSSHFWKRGTAFKWNLCIATRVVVWLCILWQCNATWDQYVPTDVQVTPHVEAYLDLPVVLKSDDTYLLYPGVHAPSLFYQEFHCTSNWTAATRFRWIRPNTNPKTQPNSTDSRVLFFEYLAPQPLFLDWETFDTLYYHTGGGLKIQYDAQYAAFWVTKRLKVPLIAPYKSLNPPMKVVDRAISCLSDLGHRLWIPVIDGGKCSVAQVVMAQAEWTIRRISDSSTLPNLDYFRGKKYLFSSRFDLDAEFSHFQGVGLKGRLPIAVPKQSVGPRNASSWTPSILWSIGHPHTQFESFHNLNHRIPQNSRETVVVVQLYTPVTGVRWQGRIRCSGSSELHEISGSWHGTLTYPTVVPL